MVSMQQALATVTVSASVEVFVLLLVLTITTRESTRLKRCLVVFMYVMQMYEFKLRGYKRLDVLSLHR